MQGLNQIAIEGNSVRLDASSSIDPEGAQLTCRWTQTGGTSVVLSVQQLPKPLLLHQVAGLLMKY